MSSTKVYFTTAEPPVAKEKVKPDKVTKEAQELWDAIQAKGMDEDEPCMVVAQVAPSVRVGIGEEFGLDPHEITPGQLVASLKKLGFDAVLDTNTAADLTIMEEGTELLQRIQKKMMDDKADVPFGQAKPGSKPMPLFTSCCPGWMCLVEKSNPELAAYISTCKSPHMMYGAILKTYSQELLGKPANQVYFCSIMPCVRKRGESDQAAFEHDGIREVDNVVTTKDLGVLFRQQGINPAELEPEPWDSPFQLEKDGEGSGAGQLFGATGGVMEAAVRTVYQVFTGEQLPRLELDAVRGLDGVKDATLHLPKPDGSGDLPLRIAVVNGLGNAKTLIKQMKAGEVEYDFVEVMACPSGCINGGGQPKGNVEKRLETIYALDRTLPIRLSHENPVIQKIYNDFLGDYGSHKAHELLHVDPVYGKLPTGKGNEAECW
eukprot:scaffold11394_cov183-Amphora_coffeaeformis.AAC.12